VQTEITLHDNKSRYNISWKFSSYITWNSCVCKVHAGGKLIK